MVPSDNSFKIIVLGEAGVGKSSLLRRFTHGSFSSRTTTTVGVDRIPMNICVDNEELQFQVLDTAGCFGFRGLIKSYMTNIDAVVFMYDISNKETFACLPLWTTLLKASGKQSITKVLVGNKRDLGEKRQVKFKNAKNYAEFEGMISMEISVKEEESVDLVFQCIARELRLKRQLSDAVETKFSHSERKLLNSSSFDVGVDSPSDSSPKQFVRKLSLMIIGGKNKNNRKQQQTRKDSAPASSLYAMKQIKSSGDIRRVEDKHYMLW